MITVQKYNEMKYEHTTKISCPKTTVESYRVSMTRPNGELKMDI